MKILYFLDDGKSLGGAAVTLILQAFLTKKMGDEVIVYLSDYNSKNYDSQYVEYIDKFQFNLRTLPFRIASTPENIDVICLDETYAVIKEEIKQQKPDLLHSIQLNIAVELAGRELNIPHIMNIYPLMEEFFSYSYLPVFPHYHICDTNYWAREWNYYLNTEYCCVRTYARETPNPIKRKDDCIHFLCVGAIYADKNQLGVIKAYHKAVKDYGINAYLHFLGDTSNHYYEECNNYVKKNKMQDRVLFHGFQNPMDLYYQMGHVLVCGSMRESYPNAISEALANNLVIVTTPVGGVPEVIVDGYNGFVSKDYCINSICEKIVQAYCLFQEDKQNTILKNARQTYLEYHSAMGVGKKLHSFYEKVCQQGVVCAECGIDMVRKKFDQFRQIYNKNMHSFSNPLEIAEKIWSLYYISDNLENAMQEGKEFYIWGTGHFANNTLEILRFFFPSLKIAGFIDSYKEGFHGEYKIYKLEDILQRRECILVSFMNGQQKAISILKENRYVFNCDYFIMAPRVW